MNVCHSNIIRSKTCAEFYYDHWKRSPHSSLVNIVSSWPWRVCIVWMEHLHLYEILCCYWMSCFLSRMHILWWTRPIRLGYMARWEGAVSHCLDWKTESLRGYTHLGKH